MSIAISVGWKYTNTKNKIAILRIKPSLMILGQSPLLKRYGGLPWRSTGEDSALPMQGAWVRSLAGEIRSHMPCGTAKKIKKQNKTTMDQDLTGGPVVKTPRSKGRGHRFDP